MAKSRQSTLVAECPSCDTLIRFHKQPRLGQSILCPECDEPLEVRRINPVVLDWADDDYEDEDDDRQDDRRHRVTDDWDSEWIGNDDY